MGKASRKKAERKALLDRPAVVYGHAKMTDAQREGLEAFKARMASLDLPDGEDIEFAPVPTWREVLANRDTMVKEIETKWS